MNKKSLNIAVTMALCSAVFSGSVLSSNAYADNLMTDNDNNNQGTSENYMYPGMGVGAATGTLVAGPIGLLVGGVLGAMFGSAQEVNHKVNQEIVQQTVNDTASDFNANINTDINADNNTNRPALTAKEAELASLQVAQLGSMQIVEDASTISHTASQQDKLLDILTTDLSLDIYFRSGSTDIESFYPARLLAIANLLENMDQLELHLDGYTDRRGNRLQNIALANQRIETVRQKLIDSGVDENRISSKAFGEMKMVSSAGDLEAYTFDRKVVIRFERSDADSIHAMKVTLSGMTPAEPETDEVVTSANDEDKGSVVADATARF